MVGGWLVNPRDKADALKTRDMETRRGRGKKEGVEVNIFRYQDQAIESDQGIYI